MRFSPFAQLSFLRLATLALTALTFIAVAPAQAQVSRCYNPNTQAKGFLPISLTKELAESGLGPHQSVLQRYSRGVMDIYCFLKIWPEQRGFLLGLGEPYTITSILGNPLRLKAWPDGYRQFRIHPKSVGHTELYMQSITASGELIVFFVPDRITEEPGFTHNEMKWLLQGPAARMRNVLFVFGAYDFINYNGLDRTTRMSGQSAVRDLIRRELIGR